MALGTAILDCCCEIEELKLMKFILKNKSNLNEKQTDINDVDIDHILIPNKYSIGSYFYQNMFFWLDIYLILTYDHWLCESFWWQHSSLYINFPESNWSIKGFSKVNVCHLYSKKNNDTLKHEIWNKVKEIIGKDSEAGIVQNNRYIPTKTKSYGI